MSVTWPTQMVESSRMTVQDDWIDYNGHLNMAYYVVLFDRACDEVFEKLGLGESYLKERNASYFTAETHICYVRELAAGMPVTVRLQLVDHDAKRCHFYQEIHHADEGWLSATNEQISLHVDMGARKVVPWPEDIAANIQALADAQSGLPRPERSGRRIEIKRKPA
ncbi:thioesterase family protein [Roseibium sp.]|uniref:thioesterase family protein n=1 Tax=Roseibium sp. TaxID=1936156 RepID=UPI003A976E14